MALYGRELSARDMECQMLAGACVNPRFTVGEVKVWQERDQAGKDIHALVGAIMELSEWRSTPGRRLISNFEARPETEFAFFLATELGMTVGDLTRRMSNWEFVQWMTFYGRRRQDAELAEIRPGSDGESWPVTLTLTSRCRDSRGARLPGRAGPCRA